MFFFFFFEIKIKKTNFASRESKQIILRKTLQLKLKPLKDEREQIKIDSNIIRWRISSK